MEDRRTTRHACETFGRVRHGVGVSYPVCIRDLNEHGCRVDIIPYHLGRNDTISVKVGNLAPLFGQIKWIHKGRSAGVQFENPIHPAILRHLIALLRSEQLPQAIPGASQPKAQLRRVG